MVQWMGTRTVIVGSVDLPLCDADGRRWRKTEKPAAMTHVNIAVHKTMVWQAVDVFVISMMLPKLPPARLSYKSTASQNALRQLYAHCGSLVSKGTIVASAAKTNYAIPNSLRASCPPSRRHASHSRHKAACCGTQQPPKWSLAG